MSPAFVSWACLAIFVAILLWDLWLYVDEVEGNSITARVTHASRKWPIVWVLIALFTGLVLGHWFWPEDADEWAGWAIVGNGVVWTAVGGALSHRTQRKTQRAVLSLAGFVLGYAGGHYWWPTNW